jgi:hypothetical protein
MLKTAYDNAQAWIRHYDTILFTLTFFVVSLSLGYAAIKIQKASSTDTIKAISGNEWLEVIFPLALTLTSIVVTRYMDIEVRAVWKRVVRLEMAMGFYDKIPTMEESVMDNRYKASGDKATSFFILSYCAQLLSLSVPIIVAFLT